jgi:CMP-N-acetylneuraminic acid synthetase
VPFYSIYITFKNDYGKIVETKTDCSYRRHEAEALAAMQSFPIKYMDNQAIIMVDKDVLLQTYHQNFEEKVMEKIKTITNID